MCNGIEMRLQRLTALERQRILDDLAEVRALIAELRALLASEEKVTEKVVEELEEIKEKYADPRRTRIGGAVEDITTEDLIIEEDMVVTISHLGYAKRNPVALYRAQRRGGKGKAGGGQLLSFAVRRQLDRPSGEWGGGTTAGSGGVGDLPQFPQCAARNCCLGWGTTPILLRVPPENLYL